MDIPPAEEKRLEWTGNLDVRYAGFHASQESPLYELQFFGPGNISPYLSQYRLDPYLNADYNRGFVGFHLKTHATYQSDDEAGADLFEAYGNYNPSFNLSFQAGKRAYSWGKGYAFNPVGYVNSVKDPENPELAQAGLMSFELEYIKSFSHETLQSFAISLVALPPPPSFKGRYEEAENTDLAAKTYFLLWNTDVDLMGYYSRNHAKRAGFDVSRNVLENLEVHAEAGYNWNALRSTIVGGKPLTERRDDASCLLGLRYLHPSNTTLIAEYYHNGLGLGRGEFESYTGFLENSVASGDSLIARQSMDVSRRLFGGPTLMRHYGYLKVSKPEPFDWLYLTPSFFTIFNLDDNSFLVAFTLDYKPVNNLELILWPTFVLGEKDSEFGQKIFQQKIEFWMRFFF